MTECRALTIMTRPNERYEQEMASNSNEADVVVVGGGVAGLSTAVNAAHLGLSVILVEKGAACGGTSRKASAGMLIPNNYYQREHGIPDPKQDFIRFLARVGRPLLYNPDAEFYGLPEWEFDLIETYYDNAAKAIEHLDAIGALRTIPQPAWSSYNEVAEDASPFARGIWPRREDGSVGNGADFVDDMVAAAQRLGVVVRTRQRVADVLLDAEDRVVGVIAEGADGARERFRARKGVVFATGGFTHNAELTRQYLNGMYIGGCTALTSEGDFVPLAQALGIPLINMHAAFGAPVVLEQSLARDPDLVSSFTTPGDSILTVNKYGDRVGNEKATYNDRTTQHFRWEPVKAEYPNFLVFPVWDQRNTDLYHRVIRPGMESAGNFIPAADGDWRYVVKADTLEELADGLRARLAAVADATGGIELADDFVEHLRASIERYNGFARDGFDADFRRGGMAIEHHMHGPQAPDNQSENKTMFPLAEQGPYYATILVPGAIDAKGGPRVNRRLQVLGSRGKPVPGLYGLGNCVASASGQAYWSGGSTFGPYIAFGYVAAHSLAEEPDHGEPVRSILED